MRVPTTIKPAAIKKKFSVGISLEPPNLTLMWYISLEKYAEVIKPAT